MLRNLYLYIGLGSYMYIQVLGVQGVATLVIVSYYCVMIICKIPNSKYEFYNQQNMHQLVCEAVVIVSMSVQHLHIMIFKGDHAWSGGDHLWQLCMVQGGPYSLPYMVRGKVRDGACSTWPLVHKVQEQLPEKRTRGVRKAYKLHPLATSIAKSTV